MSNSLNLSSHLTPIEPSVNNYAAKSISIYFDIDLIYRLYTFAFC